MTESQIRELIESLSLEQKIQVADYVAFLKHKYRNRKELRDDNKETNTLKGSVDMIDNHDDLPEDNKNHE